MHRDASPNHIFRLVWNKTLGLWQVASEITRGQGKGSGRRRLKLAAALLVAGGAQAQGLPGGGQITAGAGTIGQAGAHMTVRQSTDRLAVDWQSFSIGQGKSVTFVQPSAASIALNRVLGADVSVIQGALKANGQVFLVNPNGVLFTPTAQVNVGGLAASTLNLSKDDFLAGKYRFSGDSTASVTNQGSIAAGNGGYVALIAARIDNSGSIGAAGGSALLGAGRTVTLDLGGPVKLEVNEAALNALIDNGGAIHADGGTVLLTTRAAGELATAVINNTGIIEANGLVERNGRIVLTGDYVINSGTVQAAGGRIESHSRALLQAGAIDASSSSTGDGGSIALSASARILQTAGGTVRADGAGDGGRISLAGGLSEYDGQFVSGSVSAQGGSKGGAITITGADLSLAAANVNASGDTGGGRIEIGGGWQGKNSALVNATRTILNTSTTLRADARVQGDGGTAVVWSNEMTRFHGSVSARGGAAGGDGGAIEVSGKDTLQFAGHADAGAANGQAGLLLLDPKNITISDAGSVAAFQLIDPSPGANNAFGTSTSVLANNNVVVVNASDDFAASNAGAIHLFNGSTGALISTLTGSNVNDVVGNQGVTALANGNYVVRSQSWANGAMAGAGAVTWGSGTAGVAGVVSAANSLVGTSANDGVGTSGITALANGNYVVRSNGWDNGTVLNAGAVTWGSGTAGVAGAVSAANSLVGTTASDQIGNNAITELSNGNYVVRSNFWNNGTVTDAGAVTWGSGTTGVVGAISATNSLVGSKSSDQVGESVTALSNGNYVVRSSSWDNGTVLNVGAVTWGDGTTGVVGAISATNSLVGSTANDYVGTGTDSVIALSNGNYVVRSQVWDNGTATDAGAVTWGSGTTGVVGAVSATNSLVGTTVNDRVANNDIIELSNGNYLVRSTLWDNASATDAGAVTWGSGTAGVVGAVSAANGLVGITESDQVGDAITALSNGNYVVASTLWDNGLVADAGAVTWGSGTAGVTGVVSVANSLIGTTANDQLGGAITALANGNYVVASTLWDNGTVLNAGAATWGSGTAGVTGVVSVANSLVGTTANDQVGRAITALANGNYVVASTLWDNGTVLNAGAATWGSGTAGVTGVVSAANSLVGTSTDDNVGNGTIIALGNGNYLVRSTDWDNGTVTDAGAVTWGSGTAGVTGAVSAANSLVGTSASDQVSNGGIVLLTNGNYVVRTTGWNNGTVLDAGAATWGSGVAGVVGAVSAANSLVGTTANDQVGGDGITALTDGNYVVRNKFWDNGGVADAGAVTWGNGSTGVRGAVSAANSLVGTQANDQIGSFGFTPFANGNLLVSSHIWRNGALANAGRLDVVTPGATAFDYALGATQSLHLHPDAITRIANTGTAVLLQASNDITLNSALSIDNTGGDGGALTLQAGRSILLNASIGTDNGNLTLLANDTLANGVVDAQRDAGAAVITMAGGTSIDAGTGAVSISLADGAGKTHSTSGAVSLQAISAGNIDVQSVGATTLNGALTAGGTVSVTTGAGDLTVAANISSASTSAAAIVLNAGASAAAGTASGGNLIVSGSPSINTGAGGRATLFGGSVAGSTGLGTLVGTGSGHFRYHSDEAATHYTAALADGLYAIHREQPTLTVTADSTSITYGTAASTSASVTGLQNGDTTGQAVSTGATVTVAGGNLSTSGNYNVGTRALTLAGAAGGLGYAFNHVAGTLTVNPAAISAVTGITASNRVYDGGTAATLNTGAAAFTGMLGGDALTVATATGAFADETAATGKTVNITGISLGGADAGNYALTRSTASTTADITVDGVPPQVDGVPPPVDGAIDPSSAGIGAAIGTFQAASSPTRVAETASGEGHARTLDPAPSTGGAQEGEQLPGTAVRVVDGGIRLPANLDEK